MSINETELNKLRILLNIGEPLNLTMLGRVFGEEFWQLIVVSITGTIIKVDDLSKLTFIIGEK